MRMSVSMVPGLSPLKSNVFPSFSFSSADDGAVLQKLVLVRPGRSWIPDSEGSGSLLLRITSQNNDTELEPQSKILPPEQGMLKRGEAVVTGTSVQMESNMMIWGLTEDQLSRL